MFCFWVFAGNAALSAAAAACTLTTLLHVVMWYRSALKPLTAVSRRGGGATGAVSLGALSRRKEAELHRSVLYIVRGGGALEKMEEDGGTGKGGGATWQKEEQVKRGRGERGVYRKTMYRVFSKQEEIEGWRDVMEECHVTAEEGGLNGGGTGSTKRYSVILKEEREGPAGGREELNWVVGGWEEGQGDGMTQEKSSSWGEWFGRHLPPSTPPEGGAAP